MLYNHDIAAYFHIAICVNLYHLFMPPLHGRSCCFLLSVFFAEYFQLNFNDEYIANVMSLTYLLQLQNARNRKKIISCEIHDEKFSLILSFEIGLFSSNDIAIVLDTI